MPPSRRKKRNGKKRRGKDQSSTASGATPEVKRSQEPRQPYGKQPHRGKNKKYRKGAART